MTKQASRPSTPADQTISELIRRLDEPALVAANVIPWSCPVPSFGDFTSAIVGTLGLNPSNKEFVDDVGKELDEAQRRLHTLRSLGLARWSEATSFHRDEIMTSCRLYFSNNPYDAWFRRLDTIISGTGASYYDRSRHACHLDLIPYATRCKWTELAPQQRMSLFSVAGDALGLILRASPIRLLVLNGMTVVLNVERLSGVRFRREKRADWTLPRRSADGVEGIAFRGVVHEIGSVKLSRPVQVLGFNHNVQSSFGVTRDVISAITDWIGRTGTRVLS